MFIYWRKILYLDIVHVLPELIHIVKVPLDDAGGLLHGNLLVFLEASPREQNPPLLRMATGGNTRGVHHHSAGAHSERLHQASHQTPTHY